MKTQTASRETIAQVTRMNTSCAATAVKRVAAIVVLVVATLSLAMAEVPECAPGKLSDYEKLGTDGCLIGDKKFSNFSYHRGPNGLPRSSISVTLGSCPKVRTQAYLDFRHQPSGSQFHLVLKPWGAARVKR